MPDYTLDAVTIPEDLEWIDEFDWTPVAQNLDYGTTGALFIQESVKQKGRTITLVGKEDMAWVQRTTVESLYTLMETPGTQMTLTLPDARTFTVMFRQGEKPVDVSNVKGFENYTSTDWWKINAIRLVEVA